MTYSVLVLGLIAASIGVTAIVLPGRVKKRIASTRFTPGLRYPGAALRLAIAVILYLAADNTNFPVAVQVIAGLTLLSGLSVLVLDHAALQRWADGAPAWPPAKVRAVGLAPLALGVFLIVAWV